MIRKTMLLFAGLGMAAMSLLASAGTADAHGSHTRYPSYSSCEYAARQIRQGHIGAWCTYSPGSGIGGGAYPWVLHYTGM